MPFLAFSPVLLLKNFFVVNCPLFSSLTLLIGQQKDIPTIPPVSIIHKNQFLVCDPAYNVKKLQKKWPVKQKSEFVVVVVVVVMVNF